jgi:hypothetical protein
MKRFGFVATMLAGMAVVALVAAVAVPTLAQNGNGNGNGNNERLNADLTQGQAVGDVTPKGKARYRESRRGNKVLVVNANRIDRPVGTALAVRACGRNVGNMILDLGKLYARGRVRLRSRDGDSVPDCGAGDAVTVTGGPVKLKGNF